ncbi:MAG: sigma-54 dependent transcriptional regulator [candidate division WOR-3 bacterium]
MKVRILLVDDDRGILATVTKFLESCGYEAFAFESGQVAIREVSNIKPNIAIIDMRMPEISGMDLLSEIKKYDPNIYVIMITAYGTVDSVIEALRRRVDDFLLKPFKIQDLESALLRAQRYIELREENLRLKRELEFIKEYEIVGKSRALLDVLDKIRKIAPFDTTCVIYGETGTGKELVARAIHYNSPRKDAPFIAINMAALPEELIESELFGYRKGAYTGAYSDNPGLFKVAEGGTILLDEISEASPKLQAKLLRVLEYKVFTPLGGTREEKVDVRILAATNRDLIKLVNEGKFREDLFFRLNVTSIYIPPLRERLEDIEVLTHYFLSKFSKKYGKAIKLNSEVYEVFKAYSWPGNVRELEHIVEQIVINSEDGAEVSSEEVLKILNLKEAGLNRRLKSLRELEKEYILEVLKSTNNNKRLAAEILGIDLSTLYRKLKQIEEGE